MNELITPVHESERPVPPRSSRSHMLRLGMVVLIVLLMLAAGWLAWLVRECRADHQRAAATNTQLQSKIDGLTKQLAAAKKSSSATTNASDMPACRNVAVSQDLKDNITAAVSSKNYAALAGYMAAAVNVVIAASEKGGTETPTQAVADMAYLGTGTEPWNFTPPAADMAAFRAGDYKQYFPADAYVGEAANHLTVSFGFDDCAKIDQVFMAATSDLLRP